MNDVMNLAVVNFRTIWGNKEANLNRIVGYARCAAKQGADMVLFPEVSLSGYDDPEDTPYAEKVQVNLAEEIPGPATAAVAEVAKQYGVYIIFGMPEKVGEVVYNSAAIVTPAGHASAYRKMHLVNREPEWAKRGSEPGVFETPWGLVGIGICYDTYNFPELVSYAAAKGARLFLSLSAAGYTNAAPKTFQTKVEANVLRGNIYLATANLVGRDLVYDFGGGSHILGPVGLRNDVACLAGYPFGDERGLVPGMYMATIDLSLVQHQVINMYKNMYNTNEITRTPDWRPDIYAGMFNELAESEGWQSKTQE